MLGRTERLVRYPSRGRDQRPRLETLERRELLTGFVVTNTNDAGTGSLRQQILLANADNTVGADSISFNIPGTGTHTIALQSPLPAVTRTVVIDGASQPAGAIDAHPPTIVLDGTAAGAGANGLTFLGPGGNVVRDVAVVNFGSGTNGGGRGILVNDAGGDTFVENYLGVEPDGTTAAANVVGIELKSANNVVGTAMTGNSTDAPNLISGNKTAGILIDGAGASGNKVIGNLIGSDVSGQFSVANQTGIVIASASNNTIGGTSTTLNGLSNLISGNSVAPTFTTGIGINITGTSSGNVIAGNEIGTDSSGTKALNNVYGIYLGTPGAAAGTDTITNTTIGGTVAGAGNTISGNGIGIFGNVTTSLIAGNTIGGQIGNGYGIFLGGIGTTIGGTTAAARNTITASGKIGSGGIGLELSGDSNIVQGNQISGNQVGISLHTTNTTIGGTAAGAGNSLLGNSGDGIDLDGNSGNTLLGNTIGNFGDGVHVILPAPADGSSATTPIALNDTIGGTAANAANDITGNVGAGVAVTSNGVLYTGLTIRGNKIASNGELGISLGTTPGVPTPGTLAITSATSTASASTIYGVIGGTPGATVQVDLYSNSAADASGFGQGQVYLGSIPVTIGPGGVTGFNGTFATPLGSNPIITATSTDSSGSTSEFSAAFPGAITATDLGVTQTVSAATVSNGGIVTFTATVTNNGSTTANGVVFTDALATSLINATIATTAGTSSLTAGNVAEVQLGDLAPGASATITISANASSNGSVANTAGVVGTTPDPTYANNLASQTFTVGTVARPTADLGITVTPSTTTPTAGSNVTYTITVANHGPNDATNVTVNDFLPTAATLVSATPSQGAAAVVQGTLVSANLGTITSGSSATFTVVVTPTASGTFTNSVNVSGNQLDTVTTNNSASSTLTVAAAGPATLTLTQALSPASATPGQAQLITLTIRNTGTVPASGVILVDTLPTGSTYVAGTPSQGAATTVSNGVVTSNLGTIAAGSSATLILAITPGTATSGQVNYAGVIASGNTGSTPAFSTVPITATSNGPTVTSVVGSRSNAQLVVTFSEPITKVSATTRANYRLYALGSAPRALTANDRPIAFTTAVYNATTDSVTLTPSRAINATQYYTLVVVGDTTAGIKDTTGRKLVGVAGGAAGTNYSTTFLAGSLTQA